MELNFNIPDISQWKPNSTTLAAKYIIGDRLKDHQARALITNFVRLVDLAVDEYTLGREAILEFVTDKESFRVSRVIRASSHYEVCISTVKRAIDHLKAIRSHPRVPQKLKDLLPRSISVLSGPVEGQVTDMRDAVLHLEGKIKRGEIQEGEPSTLRVWENYISLGKHKILYSDLVDWLTELHSISSTLIDYSES
jgi:hypothetical protein